MLVLLPVGGVRLGVWFEGPYLILKRVGPCNYVVGTPGRRVKSRLCHVNLLKSYVGCEPVTPVCCVVASDSEEVEEPGYSPPEPVSATLQNTQAKGVLREQLNHVELPLGDDVVRLVESFPGLFRTPRD